MRRVLRPVRESGSASPRTSSGRSARRSCRGAIGRPTIAPGTLSGCRSSPASTIRSATTPRSRTKPSTGPATAAGWGANSAAAGTTRPTPSRRSSPSSAPSSSWAASACPAASNGITRRTSATGYRRWRMTRGRSTAPPPLAGAVGVDTEGTRRVLGLRLAESDPDDWSAAAEELLRDIVGRGVRLDRRRFVVTDGSAQLRDAAVAVFGGDTYVQACRPHREREVLSRVRAREERDKAREALRRLRELGAAAPDLRSAEPGRPPGGARMGGRIVPRHGAGIHEDPRPPAPSAPHRPPDPDRGSVRAVVDCLHGHHVRTAGNHSRSVALSFPKAGSSQPSTDTPAAISPKILADRLRRVARGAPCSASFIAALGLSGLMCPLFQNPLRPSHDRSSSSLSSQPRAVATTGDPDQTHASNSGSMTTARARSPIHSGKAPTRRCPQSPHGITCCRSPPDRTPPKRTV